MAQFKPLEEVVLTADVVGRLPLVSGERCVSSGEPVGREGLELDRVGPGRHGDVYHFERPLHGAVVVDTGLSDHEGAFGHP